MCIWHTFPVNWYCWHIQQDQKSVWQKNEWVNRFWCFAFELNAVFSATANPIRNWIGAEKSSFQSILHSLSQLFLTLHIAATSQLMKILQSLLVSIRAYNWTIGLQLSLSPISRFNSIECIEMKLNWRSWKSYFLLENIQMEKIDIFDGFLFTHATKKHESFLFASLSPPLSCYHPNGC